MAVASGPRGLALLSAIKGVKYSYGWHLTPARAAKLRPLFDLGFEAVQRDRGDWWFRRNGCELMRLSDAMRCVEAFK